MSQDLNPRQVFNEHMQEARTYVETTNLPQPVGVFNTGLIAGVELTLDVIKRHGYTLLDQHGKEVNPKDAPSLAFGVWYKPDL